MKSINEQLIRSKLNRGLNDNHLNGLLIDAQSPKNYNCANALRTGDVKKS